MQLPDLDVLLTMPAPAASQTISEAMLRTLDEADARRSAPGRARWLTAWRAFLDEAEVKGILTADQAQFTQGMLDLLENFLKSSPA